MNTAVKACCKSRLKNVVGAARRNLGRSAKTSFGIVDAQSIRNADTAGQKGYDAGKKISGIKRHIIVDTQGFPHAIHVTTADVTDRNGAIEAITQHQDAFEFTETILADGNYTGENFANAVRDLINAKTEIAKRSELHTFAVIPKRWIVERSFGWLDKARRLWKNCERKLNTSLNMTVLAFLAIILRRL